MRRLIAISLLAFLAFAVTAVQAQNDYFAGASEFTGSNNLNINGTPYYNIDSGWFRNDGIHEAGNTNYVTGFCDSCGGYTYHGYFSFDLTGMLSANDAFLQIYSYDVTTDPGIIMLWGTDLSPSDVYSGNDYNNLMLYDEIVKGPTIGYFMVWQFDSYTNVDGVFTQIGIDWLNSHLDSEVVIGASLGHAPTPEPTSLVLLGTGALAVAGMLRKRY